jgi:hypothetical protein
MVDKVPILQHLLPSVCCCGIPLGGPAAISVVMAASSRRRRFAAAFRSFAIGGRPRFRQRSPMTKVTTQSVTLFRISYIKTVVARFYTISETCLQKFCRENQPHHRKK